MSAGADYTVLVVFDGVVLERVLLARHRARGWELPGGRVEPGEGLLAAARREWTEETGLPLAHLEPLLLHRRPDGSRGHLFLGRTQAEADRLRPHPAEKIEEVRFVRAIAEVSPLAFPDDPYAETASAIVQRVAMGSWRLPSGEAPEAFVARLSQHPQARPKGHLVERHPLVADRS